MFSDSKDALLVIDAGDALLSTPGFITGASPQNQAKASTIIRAQGLMGVDAMAVGEAELAIGLEQLIKIARESRVPLLGANLVGKGGKPLFQRRLLLQRKGFKIGVFAVLEIPATQARHLMPLQKANVTTTDPAVAAKEQIAALRQEGAEVIVMVAHTGMDRAKELATQAPGAHVILVAHSGQRHQTPLRAGGTFLTEAGRRGRDLGHLQLRLGGSWSADQKLEDDSRRHVLYSDIMLEVKRIKDAQKKTGASRSLDRFKFRIERASKLALQLEQQAPPRGPHTLITRLLSLDEKWKDHAGVRALVDANKAKWTSARPPARRPDASRERMLPARKLGSLPVDRRRRQLPAHPSKRFTPGDARRRATPAHLRGRQLPADAQRRATPADARRKPLPTQTTPRP